MTALTFLEWYQQYNMQEAILQDADVNIVGRISEVANFYNQKFSVDMLVNPIESHPVFDKRESNYIKAESLRLFDGWEINGELSYLHIINNRHTIIADFLESAITFRENDNYECNEYYFYCGYDNITLNDFITLCNLSGINLSWNESNEKVKEMFK